MWFCVLPFPGRTGLTLGYKKGVGNLFLSYPVVRLWRAYDDDKTTAPHRWRYIVCLLGRVVYAYDVGAIVNYLFIIVEIAKFHN